MKRFAAIISFIRSKTLTVWLAGLFIIYYLTTAVWSKEAFASYIRHLSGSYIFRAFYILFFINIALRALTALKGLWPGKLRFFLRLPLYAGLIVFLLSFFMSLNVRKSGRMLVGEGDIVDLPWEGAQFRVMKVNSAIRKDSLKTEDSAIFDYEPTATIEDRERVMYTIGAFPPKPVGSTFMHILNFGIGPGVELRRKDKVVSEGYVALRLTPFGSIDSFEMQPFPYKFYVSILPNRIIKKGRESAREYDLTKPLYSVEITKGDKTIAKGETDGSLSFDGDITLSFFTPSDWVLLEVAYDPFLFWFAAGLALMLSGVVLYPFSLYRCHLK